jgi:hypothetical protein
MPFLPSTSSQMERKDCLFQWGRGNLTSSFVFHCNQERTEDQRYFIISNLTSHCFPPCSLHTSQAGLCHSLARQATQVPGTSPLLFAHLGCSPWDLFTAHTGTSFWSSFKCHVIQEALSNNPIEYSNPSNCLCLPLSPLPYFTSVCFYHHLTNYIFICL